MTTTILLIPGLVSDGFVWSAVTARVPAVVAAITGQDTIPHMASDLLARHAGRLILAGHSLGGRVAMEMARRAPGRIAGMALLDTALHPLREGELPGREVKIALCNSQGMAALAADWLPGMVGPGADPALLDDLTAMVCRMTPAIHERQVRALIARPDAGAGLAWRGPLLLVVGRHDRWSPVSDTEEIARICPQARLEIVEDAGHFAPVEQPGVVAHLLAEWAGQVAGAEAC